MLYSSNYKAKPTVGIKGLSSSWEKPSQNYGVSHNFLAVRYKHPALTPASKAGT